MSKLNKEDYHIILLSETPTKSMLLELIKKETDKPILIIVDNDKEEKTLQEALKDYREPIMEIPIVAFPRVEIPYFDDIKHGWDSKPSYVNIKHTNKHKRKRKQ